MLFTCEVFNSQIMDSIYKQMAFKVGFSIFIGKAFLNLDEYINILRFELLVVVSSHTSYINVPN